MKIPVVSAPGKVILFGEHAVVYGEPAIAVAVNMRMKMSATRDKRYTVNGYTLSPRYHSYIHTAVSELWNGRPLKFSLTSNIPTGVGFGSSAALSVCSAFTLGLMKRSGSDEEEDDVKDDDLVEKALKKDATDEDRIGVERDVAKRAFIIEYLTQEGASPIDTSTTTHGGGVILRKEIGEGLLWKASVKDKEWFVHHAEIGELPLILGDTGIRSRTDQQVEKVRRFVRGSTFGREIVSEIGQVVEEGAKALGKRDWARVGELMDKNQQLLGILGVSHPKIDKLLKTVRRHSFGAKLTGAGGGGSFIAITDTPDKAIASLERYDIPVFKLDPSKRGIMLEREGSE